MKCLSFQSRSHLLHFNVGFFLHCPAGTCLVWCSMVWLLDWTGRLGASPSTVDCFMDITSTPWVWCWSLVSECQPLHSCLTKELMFSNMLAGILTSSCWKFRPFNTKMLSLFMVPNPFHCSHMIYKIDKLWIVPSPQRLWVCLWPSSWNSETTCSTCWQARSPQSWFQPFPCSCLTSIRHWASSSMLPSSCWQFSSTMPAGPKTCTWIRKSLISLSEKRPMRYEVDFSCRTLLLSPILKLFYIWNLVNPFFCHRLVWSWIPWWRTRQTVNLMMTIHSTKTLFFLGIFMRMWFYCDRFTCYGILNRTFLHRM